MPVRSFEVREVVDEDVGVKNDRDRTEVLVPPNQLGIESRYGLLQVLLAIGDLYTDDFVDCAGPARR